jgi:hypothetical protein
MTFEGGKRDAAVSRVMLMVKQIAGHARRLAAPGAGDIREAPLDQAVADDAYASDPARRSACSMVLATSTRESASSLRKILRRCVSIVF